MRKILRFALREYKASVRTKGFIIGLIVAPIFMSGSVIAFVLLKDRVDTTDKHVVVIDHNGNILPGLKKYEEVHNSISVIDEETGEKIRPEYHFIETEAAENIQEQYLELSDRVRAGELHAFLVIGRDVVHPGEDPEAARIMYYARNAAMDDLRKWISGNLNNHLRLLRLEDAGVSKEAAQSLFIWVEAEGLGLLTRDEDTGGITDAKKASPIEALAVPIGIMMILMLMIMMSVPGMLQSIMEEKTQRIAEVLLGAISPFEFMMGKLLGGIAVSLTSSSVYLVGGIAAVTYMGYDDYIPYHVLP